MKSSQPLNVKVAVFEKNPVVLRLTNLMLVAFAVVAAAFMVELQIAVSLGLF